MKLQLNSILLVFPYDFNIFRFHIRFQSFPLVGFPVITGPAVEVEKISDSARFFSRQNTKGGRSQFYKVTKGSTRTLIGCYANLRLRLGIAQLSRILPTRLVFISVYANTENVSLNFIRLLWVVITPSVTSAFFGENPKPDLWSQIIWILHYHKNGRSEKGSFTMTTACPREKKNNKINPHGEDTKKKRHKLRMNIRNVYISVWNTDVSRIEYTP